MLSVQLTTGPAHMAKKIQNKPWKIWPSQIFVTLFYSASFKENDVTLNWSLFMGFFRAIYLHKLPFLI